jgi:hypothetical protein
LLYFLFRHLPILLWGVRHALSIARLPSKRKRFFCDRHNALNLP